MGASATAAVIVLKERQIVEAFRRFGATSAGTAVAPVTLGVPEHLIFRKLRRRAVLREARSGLFYLDEPSWKALRHMRQRFGVALALVVIVAALAIWLWRFGLGAA